MTLMIFNGKYPNPIHRQNGQVYSELYLILEDLLMTAIIYDTSPCRLQYRFRTIGTAKRVANINQAAPES